MSIRNKYNRPTPKVPPKKKGNSDVISQIIQDPVDKDIHKPVSTEERKIKKATFELDADLHKRLRTQAAINDTTMLEIVEKAIKEYLDKLEM